MREAVSGKLLLHPEFYGNHPYITKKICNNLVHHPNLIFALTISSSSSVNLTDGNSKGNFIINEAVKNESTGAWSLLVCMLRLSSVLCCNIDNTESVYPDQSSLVGKIQNGSKKTRNSEFKTRDRLAFLWTRSKNAVGTFRSNILCR